MTPPSLLLLGNSSRLDRLEIGPEGDLCTDVVLWMSGVLLYPGVLLKLKHECDQLWPIWAWSKSKSIPEHIQPAASNSHLWSMQQRLGYLYFMSYAVESRNEKLERFLPIRPNGSHIHSESGSSRPSALGLVCSGWHRWFEHTAWGMFFDILGCAILFFVCMTHQIHDTVTLESSSVQF